MRSGTLAGSILLHAVVLGGLTSASTAVPDWFGARPSHAESGAPAPPSASAAPTAYAERSDPAAVPPGVPASQRLVVLDPVSVDPATGDTLRVPRAPGALLPPQMRVGERVVVRLLLRNPAGSARPRSTRMLGPVRHAWLSGPGVHVRPITAPLQLADTAPLYWQWEVTASDTGQHALRLRVESVVGSGPTARVERIGGVGQVIRVAPPPSDAGGPAHWLVRWLGVLGVVFAITAAPALLRRYWPGRGPGSPAR